MVSKKCKSYLIYIKWDTNLGFGKKFWVRGKIEHKHGFVRIVAINITTTILHNIVRDQHVIRTND